MAIQQVAVYPNAQEARDVVQKLQHSNVDRDRISVVLADSGEARDLMERGPASEGEAAKLGATVGGTLWGLAAVGLALNPIAVIATGPILAGLIGAGAGAVSGGLLGALVGKGIPEHEAVLREREIANGGVMVLVETDEAESEKVVEALRTGKALHEFTL